MTMRLGAFCALAIVSAFTGLPSAQAQADTSSQSSVAKKTTSAKTANSKTAVSTTHIKSPAAKSKAVSSSTAKAHPTSHPQTHSNSSTTAAVRRSKLKRASSKKKPATRGQQKIDPERAEAIQEALIREHYMNGEPAGTWNQASEDALRRYQADHGWQSKTVPDSRALISLGLGPSHDHLLNPESAMTTGPEVSHAASVSSSSQPPLSHSAGPGAGADTSTATPVDTTPVSTADHDAPSPQ
jgi:hypothetical protein